MSYVSGGRYYTDYHLCMGYSGTHYKYFTDGGECAGTPDKALVLNIADDFILGTYPYSAVSIVPRVMMLFYCSPITFPSMVIVTMSR